MDATAAAPTPSLPQHPPTAERAARAARAAQLARARTEYTYTYDTVVAPLGVAAAVPKGEGVAPVLAATAVLKVLDLVSNVLAKATKIFGGGAPRVEGLPYDDADLAAVADVVATLDDAYGRLSRVLSAIHRPLRAQARELAGPVGLLARVEAAVESRVGERLREDPGQDAFDLIGELLKTLLSSAGQLVLRYLDLYGEAPALVAYSEQFQTIRVPEIDSIFLDDRAFAWMRVAGPNPLLIQGIRGLPANLPLTEAQYQAAMPGDTLAKAGVEGRLFLCDYAALANVEAGSYPDQAKYLTAPLALFAVPPEDHADRALHPVAIQLAQEPADDAPIFTPGSAAWELAKVHVQVADGNYHETISHLGRTHLVLEAFGVTTPRQLAESHPLYLLLKPHLAGTLFINDAAVNVLVADEGVVDRLLSGTIQASRKLAVDAVLDYPLNQNFLPEALGRRNVETLPSYPYRDDGLLVWRAIHGWVGAYLGVYYRSDEDVRGDDELQGWIRELGSQEGGRLPGVLEPGCDGIHTFAYLVDFVTMAIFTASAQHAAVNFPQNFVMSYTPAMPLAAYQPPPTDPSCGDTLLATLPPLQQAIVQQAVGYVLGGVYYTRLGDYDRNIPGRWFTDARVQAPLARFQADLQAAEAEIGRRNLSRVPYVVLLPSQIPQSINI